MILIAGAGTPDAGASWLLKNASKAAPSALLFVSDSFSRTRKSGMPAALADTAFDDSSGTDLPEGGSSGESDFFEVDCVNGVATAAPLVAPITKRRL